MQKKEESPHKNIKLIVILCILLFITVTVGIFIVENLIKEKIDETNPTTKQIETTIETTNMETDIAESNSDIETTKTEESNSDIETTKTEESKSETESEETKKEKVKYNKEEKQRIAKDLLKNLIPEESSIIKNIDEDRFYFKTKLKNNTKYNIQKVELSYKVDDGIYTYLTCNEPLEIGSQSKELQCYAKSGTEIYELFSQNIIFLDENNQEHSFTYIVNTKKITFD